MKLFMLVLAPIFLCSAISFSTLAQVAERIPPDLTLDDEFGLSAERGEFESFDEALWRNSFYGDANEIKPFFSRRSTAVNRARLYKSGIDVSTLPVWQGTDEELLSVFRTMRDERRYSNPNSKRFTRRAPWLFPFDGCHLRATHAAQSMARQGHTRPGKVYAFGHLRLKTPYDRRGIVYWWFHVAAAYRKGNSAVILDPSIDPSRPLSLQNWLSRMHADPFKVKVSICDTYAYSPNGTCIGASARAEAGFRPNIPRLLSREWRNLRSLRMKPEVLLNDNPPWSLYLSDSNNQRVGTGHDETAFDILASPECGQCSY